MLNCKALFSSARNDWRTPRLLYAALDRIFRFDCDPCPARPRADGLSRDWGASSFVNPPYGRAIGRWTAKGLAESRQGKTVVMLVPARTDTAWWHDHMMKAAEIWFIRGRLKFDDGTHPAPFPSAIAVFRDASRYRHSPQVRSFGLKGLP